MKKYIFLWLLAFSLFLHNSPAQKVYSYEKGMIVKKKGDTIRCYIPMSVYYASKVKYRLDEGSVDKTLKTEEIKLLQTPYNTFENILIDNKEYLMRIVASGKIMLYTYIIPDENSNARGGTYIFKAPTIYYTIKKENAFFVLTQKDYKEQLSEHLSDCPQLSTKIVNNSFKFEDIDKIIDEYNKCAN